MNKDNLTYRAIAKAVAEHATFFAFRLPQQDNIIFGAETNRHATKRFIVHPFVVSQSTPHVEIYSDLTASEFLQASVSPCTERCLEDVSMPRSQYIKLIDDTIECIKKGVMQKVVISNTEFINNHKISAEHWSEIFCQLCKRYPNAYVFVFNSAQTGYWIGASPEKLLSYKDGTISTMALAATRPVGTIAEWGSKEREEQAMVRNYIESCFKAEQIECKISELYTRNAGNIEHLCNNFTASNVPQQKIKTLLERLHPTPALAGLPKQIAVDYINFAEPHTRNYYGGYMGLISQNEDFDFYVNLRSVEYNSLSLCLYAGGGITKDSNPAEEYVEIQNKFNTLKLTFG